jgi:NADH-quinone oxidoreductase subunit L
VLLLLGACGKSGQFPLQAWLPDAMEGPTPVSALIHAATMVTAGVYLIARCNPIYNLTETGRLVVAPGRRVTLLIGAIIGCAYDDIKKVLAYSTVSQIGYMFLAVGLGPAGYALGICHLLTHGFFKAGLFLGAGSVMHAMNDDVDMRRYGGLAGHADHVRHVRAGLPGADRLPVPVRATSPRTRSSRRRSPSRAGRAGCSRRGHAGRRLTAFYMTRLMLMTFFGEKRWEKLKSEDGQDYHPHESPVTMTVPMIVLALGSVGRASVLPRHGLADWLAPSLGELEERRRRAPARGRPVLVSASPRSAC